MWLTDLEKEDIGFLACVPNAGTTKRTTGSRGSQVNMPEFEGNEQ